MLTDIEPVNREPTAAIIARQLREAITTGTLAPGAQLGETELATQFRVSRGPLREAMQRLVSEGLLRSERHRGLFVIEPEAEDLQDIYCARLAIERAAVIRIMRRGNQDEIATRLADTVQAMARAADHDEPAALAEADLAFHETLTETCGSSRLSRMARTLMAETRMCLSSLESTRKTTKREMDERVAEYHRILEAWRAGDEDLVLQLLETHMEDAVRRLVPEASPHP